jgi:predicted extracellular nuclease
VEGIVTATRGTFRVDNAYVQDATSGVQIFNLPLSLTLALGDSIHVHGKMTTFGGESEIVNNIAITDSIKVTKLGTRAPLAPKVITGAQFLSRAFEGQLVTVQSVTIVTVGTAGGSGTYTVTGTAPDGSPMTIFMSAPTGAVPPPGATYTVGSRYHLTGIAVPFGTPSVAELKPRGAADVVVAP